MKKISTLVLYGILGAFLCFSAVSCGSETDTAADSADTAAPVETAPAVTETEITSGSKAVYKIIRGENASDEIVDTAIRLRRGLEELTGISFSFGTDWSADGSTGEGALEILVGLTNRPESAAADAEIRNMEYSIASAGNKIVISGKNAETLSEAVQVFLNSDLISLNDAGNYVYSGQSVKGELLLADGKLPFYPNGELSFYVSSDNTQVMKSVGTDAESYLEYRRSMENMGYTLYMENTIGDNLFATYTSDELSVTAYYIENNRTTRVVWESLGMLPDRKEDNVYDTAKTVPTMLTGIELAEGMSYVFRLEDNSFIIFDGGRIDPDEKAADDLMEVLRSQTPEGEKPVVAAWMFSHPHGDHLGTFNYFVLKYHDEVTIEEIYYNFANDEDIWAVDPQVLDPTYYQKLGYHYWEYCSGYYFFKHIEEYLPDVQRIKPHTGDRYYIRNAEIEILGTIEDMLPKTIVSMGEGGNSQNVTYRVYLEGQSFLMLGDASENNCRMMVEQFGDYMKSDVLQLAHHGGYGGTVELYEIADPEYSLLPTTLGGYMSVINSELNQVLVNNENMKLMFVSGYGTYSVNLPIDLQGEYSRLPRRGRNPALFE